MVCCALIACKKNSVDFTYSPTAPKAGETVTFSNQSASGEDWNWAFGDGATSTLKTPTHVYKQPGTYHVVLTVDNNKSWRAAADITVYDTIPTFTASDSIFVVFEDYTFTANVYNPYNYSLTYEWTVPNATSSTTESTVTCFFSRPDEIEEVTLRVILKNDTTVVRKEFFVYDVETNSMLFRTADGDYRQRIFGARAEELKAIEPNELLDDEQDVMQWYNDSLFTLAALETTFPGIEGFKIANRKIYYRANGLWVANIDGAYKVQIDATECAAMTLDTKDSRICWANENGVWYMPFVGSDNNKFVTVPTLLNDLKNVTKIAADAELK